jgi:hypothetical protein
MTTHRHHGARLTLGVRMALLPALLAAAATLAIVGVGRYGLGLGEALLVGVLVAAVIAFPVDRASARARAPRRRTRR